MSYQASLDTAPTPTNQEIKREQLKTALMKKLEALKRLDPHTSVAEYFSNVSVDTLTTTEKATLEQFKDTTLLDFTLDLTQARLNRDMLGFAVLVGIKREPENILGTLWNLCSER